MPGGHIEAFYTLGGLAMYPSAHTQEGMIHLRGGRATFRGGEVPRLLPSKKTVYVYVLLPVMPYYMCEHSIICFGITHAYNHSKD